MGNLEAKHKRSKKRGLESLLKKVAKTKTPALLYDVSLRVIMPNESFRSIIKIDEKNIPILKVSTPTQPLFGGDPTEAAISFLERNAHTFAKGKVLKFLWSFRVGSGEKSAIFSVSAVRVYEDIPILQADLKQIDESHKLYPQVQERITTTKELLESIEALEEEFKELERSHEDTMMAKDSPLHEAMMEKKRLLDELNDIRKRLDEKQAIEKSLLDARSFKSQRSNLKTEHRKILQEIRRIVQLNEDAPTIGSKVEVSNKLDNQIRDFQYEKQKLERAVSFFKEMPDVSIFELTNYKFIYNQYTRMKKIQAKMRTQQRLLKEGMKRKSRLRIRSVSEYKIQRKKSLKRVGSVIKKPESFARHSITEMNNMLWQDMLTMPEVIEKFVEYLHASNPSVFPLWVCFQDLSLLDINVLKEEQIMPVAQFLFNRYIKISSVFRLELSDLKEIKGLYMSHKYSEFIQTLFNSVQKVLQFTAFSDFKRSKIFAEFIHQTSVSQLMQYESIAEYMKTQQAGIITRVYEPNLLNVIEYTDGMSKHKKAKKSKEVTGLLSVVSDLLDHAITLLEQNYSTRDGIIKCNQLRFSRPWVVFNSTFNRVIKNADSMDLTGKSLSYIKALIINLYNLLVVVGIVNHGIPTEFNSLSALENYVRSFFILSEDRRIYVRDLVPPERGIKNYLKVFVNFPDISSDPNFARDISLATLDIKSNFNLLQVYSEKYFSEEIELLKDKLRNYILLRSKSDSGGEFIIMGRNLRKRLRFRTAAETYQYLFGEKPKKKFKLRKKKNLSPTIFLEA